MIIFGIAARMRAAFSWRRVAPLRCAMLPLSALTVGAIHGVETSAAEIREQPVVSEALMAARAAFSMPPLNVITFRSMREMFPIQSVAPSRDVLPLEVSGSTLSISYKYDGDVRSLDNYLVNTKTNALVVLKDGEVVHETYLNGSNVNSMFTVMSISKSIVSLLVGAAIDAGEIDGVDAPITRYAPDFAGSAYDGVTIAQALQMRSGVAFDEEGEDFNKYMNEVIAGNNLRCADFAKSLERVHEPGSVFNYSSPETCVIARVLENATGKSLATLTEKYLWGPAGMEHEAYWLLDGATGFGTAIANGGFNSTARDLARIGQLFVDEGKAGDQRVLSSEWLNESTTGYPNADGHLRYGYQWWLSPDGSVIVGQGYGGQFLYIVPKQALVIAKLSYWPSGWEAELEAETFAGFSAIQASFE